MFLKNYLIGISKDFKQKEFVIIINLKLCGEERTKAAENYENGV